MAAKDADMPDHQALRDDLNEITSSYRELTRRG